LGLHHRVLDVKVLDKNDKWNTFTAFVLCVEIGITKEEKRRSGCVMFKKKKNTCVTHSLFKDDLVRAKSICNQLKQQCSSSLVYPDVKVNYNFNLFSTPFSFKKEKKKKQVFFFIFP
jgi:hypothetical protein